MKTTFLGMVALAAIIAVPSLSLAATFAYVNQSGEVMTTEAASANEALMTAPNLGTHSGVMLINSSTDSEVVGDRVNGV
ncbi:hypothetical protein KKD81_01625 [Patescibacteria group bacterium]|nr:hypothetical protein [Patescibacteria group bacterium]MBU2158991.1 hypothetical protein [Patescibacteria group bacterium]MBU2220618.1 hypothetical protein [Patescibacteria group bacterium]